MNFYELCKSRYSVRKFKPEHIRQEDLDYILNCGRVAPTACNNQPQRIFVLNSDEVCAKLRLCTVSQSHAPTALLICYDKAKAWVRQYDGASSGQVDASIVTTHMMLAAAEIGVGAVWVMKFDVAKTRELLELPDDYEPVAFLMMGYPADDAIPAHMHGERLPLEETVCCLSDDVKGSDNV